MGGWSDLLKSDSEIAQEEHNRGQEDGSKADIFDQIAHNWGGSLLESDEYNTGWENGVNNQPQEK